MYHKTVTINSPDEASSILAEMAGKLMETREKTKVEIHLYLRNDTNSGAERIVWKEARVLLGPTVLDEGVPEKMLAHVTRYGPAMAELILTMGGLNLTNGYAPEVFAVAMSLCRQGYTLVQPSCVDVVGPAAELHMKSVAMNAFLLRAWGQKANSKPVTGDMVYW